MKLVRPINVLAGAAFALGARALLPRLLLLKFSGAVAQLNEGDHRALLDSYADDFVLHFNAGPHRWSGDWVGRTAWTVSCGTSPRPGSKGRS